MKATIFVIGSLVGSNGQYKNFSYEQAKQMYESELISIQSHTYDMHQDITIYGENEETYMNMLREDIRRSIRLIKDYVGNDVIALSYPGGLYSSLANVILKKEGIKVTFIEKEKPNEIVKGLSQSLFALGRYNVTENTNMTDFILNLNGNSSMLDENLSQAEDNIQSIVEENLSQVEDNVQSIVEENFIQVEEFSQENLEKVQEVNEDIINIQFTNENKLQNEISTELNDVDVIEEYQNNI
jgi:hypothetical protein